MKTLNSAFLVCLLIALGASVYSEEGCVLVVYDFECTKEGLGEKLAFAIRAKLARSDEFILVDETSLKEALERTGLVPRLDALEELVRFSKENLGAEIAICGKAQDNGQSLQARVKAIDLREDKPDVFLEDIFNAKGERRLAEVSGQIAEALLGPQTHPAARKPPPVSIGPNLLANGDFEKGKISPVGWEKVDGLTTFWEEKGTLRGKCLKMDTDVYLEEWKRWEAEFKAGRPAFEAPSKTPTKGPKYNTVGGTYGVLLYSDFIPVKPGARYFLSCDVKGPSGRDAFAKVFVKGYGALGGERREIYRMYLACRTKTNGKEWEQFSRSFHPTKRTPGTGEMRVMLYAYWPPGQYYFDNLLLAEIKDSQSASQPTSKSASHNQQSIIYGPGSFEAQGDLKAWEQAYGVRAALRATGLVTQGKFCVRLAYPEEGGGNFRLAEGYFRAPGRIKNLSPYEALAFDVKNANEFPAEVGIRIKGGGFDATVYSKPIPPGQVAKLVYKIEHLARVVDVTYINYFGILCKNEASKEAVIFVDNLRLITAN